MGTKLSPVGSSASGSGAATEVTVGTTVVDGGVTNTLLKTDSSGNLANATGVTNASGKVLTLTSQAVGDEPLTIQLVAGQTGDAIEVYDNAGTKVFSVDELGNVRILTTAYGAQFRITDANGLQFLVDVDNGFVSQGNAIAFKWLNPGTLATDLGYSRLAAGVMRITDGVSGFGWLQNAGESRVAGNVTNATGTMANITGLSATLAAGRTYVGRICVFCEDSTAADGIKFDFDGGTATATDFRAQGTIFDTALQLSVQTTALATDFSAATITGGSVFTADFTITVNAAGTFIPRFAQVAHTTGTATAFRGSYMLLQDCP